MILGKMWSAFRAQLNKIANFFWEADPIAQMRYEYDLAVEQLKEGRKGLEMYRGLVERVRRYSIPYGLLPGLRGGAFLLRARHLRDSRRNRLRRRWWWWPVRVPGPLRRMRR